MSAKMIASHELILGKTIKDHIHVEGTELHVPHVLLCGARPGPTVLISAGIHNAEYVGIQADKADVRSILRCLGILDGDWTVYPKQELLSTTTMPPAQAAGIRKRSRATAFKRVKSWGKYEITSDAVSLRKQHPQTVCCCISAHP